MKIEECTSRVSLVNYLILNSLTWENAYLVVKRKIELISSGTYDFYADEICGFCKILKHKNEEDWDMNDSCGQCPVLDVCPEGLFNMRIIDYGTMDESRIIYFANNKIWKHRLDLLEERRLRICNWEDK